MKRIAISQSNYIPWKGYFDLIKSVDEFVLYDEVQFTKNDWRNRNQLMTPAGPKWLTIPVQTSNRFGQAIRDTLVVDQRWRRKHWHSWQANYAHSPGLALHAVELEALYLGSTEQRLSQINLSFIHAICRWLEIRTPITWSSDYSHDAEDPSARLVQICRAARATHYLSGPAARAYLRPDLFHAAGIAIEWMDYSNYPVYRQSGPGFVHSVSALDLILQEGPHAGRFLKPASACIRRTSDSSHAL